MLTIKRLRCFVAVAEEGQFNKAALRLGISQPPLTEHIQTLEHALGCRLFERSTRSLRLSDHGQRLLEHARHLLSLVDQTHEVVMRDSTVARPLRLGLLHAHTYTFLPGLLRQFSDAHPAHDVQLVEYSTSGQVQTLLSPSVDLGLVREPLNHPEINTQTLFTEPYVLAIPTALRPPKVVDISLLNDRPIIGYPSHDDKRSTRSLFRDFLSQHNVQPSHWREVTTMHSALALVSANLGIAPVPASQQTLRLSGVAYRPIEQSPPNLSVGLARRVGTQSDIADHFTKIASDYFQGLMP
jgi:DNA-binding transcriptional LysR family regulator